MGKFSELPKEIREAFLQGDWERKPNTQSDSLQKVILDYENLGDDDLVNFCVKYEQLIEDLEFKLEEIEKMKAQSDRGIDLQIKRIKVLEDALKEKDKEIGRLNKLLPKINLYDYLQKNKQKERNVYSLKEALKYVDEDQGDLSFAVYSTFEGIQATKIKGEEECFFICNYSKTALFDKDSLFIYKFKLL